MATDDSNLTSLQLVTARAVVRALSDDLEAQRLDIYGRWEVLKNLGNKVTDGERMDRAVLWSQLEGITYRRLGVLEALDCLWLGGPSATS